MSVLAKGDLRREYGVDWRDLKWLTLWKEQIPSPGLPLTQLPPDADPTKMLLEGNAAALVHPHPPQEALSGRHGIRRLFVDTQEECERYFRRHRYLPIMHLLAIQNSVVQREPELPAVLMRTWNEARALTEDSYQDPAFGLPVFTRLAYERQKVILGEDPWSSGVGLNRLNLSRFMEDMVDQRLLAHALTPEELFHASVLDT